MCPLRCHTVLLPSAEPVPQFPVLAGAPGLCHPSLPSSPCGPFLHISEAEAAFQVPWTVSEATGGLSLTHILLWHQRRGLGVEPRAAEGRAGSAVVLLL